MADETGKPASKAGETTLGLIGALAGLAGNVIFGPDSIGIDFGAPFKAGAEMLKQKRTESDLQKVLMSTPHTAPLADVIPSLIGAGGIINNPDILSHPDTQNYMKQFGSGVAASPSEVSNLQPAPSGVSPSVVSAPLQVPGMGSPSGNLLTTLQTNLNNASPAMQARFLSDHPEIAKSMMKSEPDIKDYLQTVLLGKQISSFETPEQKRQAALEDRIFQSQETDRLLAARQEKNQVRGKEMDKQTKRETWTPKEDENYNTLNQAVDLNRMLLEKVKGGQAPGMMTALLSGSQAGSAVLQRFFPGSQEMIDQIQTARDLTKIVMGDVKAQSGATYSVKELQWMQSAMPSKFDTPEQLQHSLASDALKKQWLLYNIVATKVEKAGNLTPAEERGISLEQLKAFSALKKQLTKGSPEDIFKRKDNIPYLESLGMDYLVK